MKRFFRKGLPPFLLYEGGSKAQTSVERSPKIARHFLAGTCVPPRGEIPQGRKNVEPISFLLAGLDHRDVYFPVLKHWPIFATDSQSLSHQNPMAPIRLRHFEQGVAREMDGEEAAVVALITGTKGTAAASPSPLFSRPTGKAGSRLVYGMDV